MLYIRTAGCTGYLYDNVEYVILRLAAEALFQSHFQPLNRSIIRASKQASNLI